MAEQQKTELEKLIDDEGKNTAAPASGENQGQEDSEIKKKEEIKKNLDKAIVEAQDELKNLRKEKKDITGKEEDLPVINTEDPNSKAWIKKIDSTVAPVQDAMEKEKSEVRSFALRKFLSDKPNLAANPEKVKELMNTYEALSRGNISERTQEGVLVYLDKAYAAVFHEDILNNNNSARVDRARAEGAFAEIAVDQGATGYQSPKDVSNIKLTQDEVSQLARWGMSPQEWIELKKKYG
jgi:hypothetical protein